MEVDDITIGQWVTPRLDPRRRANVLRILVDEDGDVVSQRARRTMCGVAEGIPMRVLGISLPFVVCGVLYPGGREVGPEIIDVRSVRLVSLDPSYVQAIIDFKDPEEAAESNSEVEMNGIGVE